MKLNKAEVADLLEREYVNGTATLKVLAARIGCTWVSLALIGKQLVPGYAEAARRRKAHKSPAHKFILLRTGK